MSNGYFETCMWLLKKWDNIIHIHIHFTCGYVKIPIDDNNGKLWKSSRLNVYSLGFEVSSVPDIEWTTTCLSFTTTLLYFLKNS